MRNLTWWVVAFALAVCSHAQAQTVLVNSFGDAVDAQPGDCLCDADLATPGNQCTLRAAIMEANACGLITHILLPGGTYAIGIGGGGENGCVAGDMDIVGIGLTIESIGGTAFLDASGLDRYFDVLSGGGLRLVGCAIYNGDPGIGSFPGSTSQNGGAIRVGGFGGPGSLELEDVLIESNKATLSGLTPSRGGGVWVNGTATLTSCTLRGNQAKSGGGGLHADAGAAVNVKDSHVLDNDGGDSGGGLNLASGAQVNMTDCIVARNHAIAGGGIWANGPVFAERTRVQDNYCAPAANGGGAVLQGGGLLRDVEITGNFSGGGGGGGVVSLVGMSMDRVLLAGNIATFDGGGLMVLSSMRAVNCILAHNTSVAGQGGGLSVSANGNATLVHCSVAHNTAASAGGIAVGDAVAPGLLELGSTILEGNLPMNVGFIHPFSTATSRGSNLDSDGTFPPVGPGDWLGAAGLGPLTYTGGFIAVMQPNAFGPAIDSVLPGGCVDVAGVPLAMDARWWLRPWDGNGDGVAVCDRGAVEMPTACLGDCNGDGTIDGADLGALLAVWNGYAPCADLNGDGTVNGADLGMLLARWGPCP